MFNHLPNLNMSNFRIKMTSTTINDSNKSQQPAVLTEVPENLERLLLTLVKTFYGLECYTVFNYIQKEVILKDEELRDLCKIDMRQLRKFLATLKVEKFIKERIVPEEVDGKIRKFNYYFVNYKGALNVTKYKIDHIRQKLEVREKDDVHRAFYRCTTEMCKRQYDAMDMGKIFDTSTEEMRCWQCKGLVEQDDSGGPSQVTRSSMAKFNEQMTGIYSLLKQMNGIRFGREITEPPIKASIPKTEEESIELDGKKIANLGQRAFSTAGKTRTDLFKGDIIVSIGDDNQQNVPEAKAAIPWLATSRQNLAEETSTARLLNPNELNAESTSTNLQNGNGIEVYEMEEEPSQLLKKPRIEEIKMLLAEEEEELKAAEKDEEEGEDEEDGMHEVEESTFKLMAKEIFENGNLATEAAAEIDEEELFILVQGSRVHIDQIDAEKLGQMTAEEKADYYERMQGAYADFY